MRPSWCLQECASCSLHEAASPLPSQGRAPSHFAPTSNSEGPFSALWRLMFALPNQVLLLVEMDGEAPRQEERGRGIDRQSQTRGRVVGGKDEDNRERRVFRKAALNSGCTGGKNLDLATISMAQAATHLSHSHVWAHNPFAANHWDVPILSFSKVSGWRVLRATLLWAYQIQFQHKLLWQFQTST